MLKSRAGAILSTILIFVLIQGCDDNTEIIVPNLSMGSNEYVEGNGEGMTPIVLRLSEAVDNDVIFDYVMLDETAKESEDYINQEGTILFEAGVKEKILNIQLVGDNHIELRESFNITFTSPDKLERPYPFQVFIIDDDISYDVLADEEGFYTPTEYPSMTLEWSDEFDGNSLDLSNWTYELGDGCDKGICGWGNEELQEYTDSEDNVFIENGKLVIKATEKTSCGCYASGRIITQDKQEFTFGRIDIRAKLPEGQGLWPAIWMLGANINEVGWPACGELDIMEYLGHQPHVVHGTIHYDDNGYKTTKGAYGLDVSESFGDKFHVFSILWDRNKITWLMDYIPYKTVSKDEIGDAYPFNNPQFFIFNVAVGGRWPGYPDETTSFPQQMEIDYIRIFK
jgi:beta-glucanase (GH16 family)